LQPGLGGKRPPGYYVLEIPIRGSLDMEMIEKARIRLRHWIEHNSHHIEDYEVFAKELEGAGKRESAGYIREMIRLAEKSNEVLRNALDSLTRG